MTIHLDLDFHYALIGVGWGRRTVPLEVDGRLVLERRTVVIIQPLPFIVVTLLWRRRLRGGIAIVEMPARRLPEPSRN